MSDSGHQQTAQERKSAANSWSRSLSALFTDALQVSAEIFNARLEPGNDLGRRAGARQIAGMAQHTTEMTARVAMIKLLAVRISERSAAGLAHRYLDVGQNACGRQAVFHRAMDDALAYTALIPLDSFKRAGFAPSLMTVAIACRLVEIRQRLFRIAPAASLPCFNDHTPSRFLPPSTRESVQAISSYVKANRVASSGLVIPCRSAWQL